MDQTRFDAMTRNLTSLPTCRHVLRGLAGAGLGISSLGLPGIAEAKKKHKGKKNKKKRRETQLEPPPVTSPEPPSPPPFAGNCSVQRNYCDGDPPVLSLCALPSEKAFCLVTIGGLPFCGSVLGFDVAVHCRACNTGADCEDVGFPPGSACVQLGGSCNACEAAGLGNRACIPPALPA